MGALIGCPRCKQTLREPESCAKRHVLTPYKLGCCSGRVRHNGQMMSAGCVIDNQMWSGRKKMCPHVTVSALEVITLVNITLDTEACQTKRDPARCHHMSPRHQNISQTSYHVSRHGLSTDVSQMLQNLRDAKICRQKCSDVARRAKTPPNPTWGQRSDVADVGRTS